jgi:hypothetical protein
MNVVKTPSIALANTLKSHLPPYRQPPANMATNNPNIVKVEIAKPWHAAYPAPKESASAITRGTLLSWMLNGKTASKDFVLVDLRRTDFEVHLLLFPS